MSPEFVVTLYLSVPVLVVPALDNRFCALPSYVKFVANDGASADADAFVIVNLYEPVLSLWFGAVTL